MDIYSLGILLYRLMNNNRLSFLDTEKQLLSPSERRNAVDRRLRGERLSAPSEASPAMAQVILRACAFDPDARFATATEMKRALMGVANGAYRPAAQKTPGRPAPARRAPEDPNRTIFVRRAPGNPGGAAPARGACGDSNRAASARRAPGNSNGAARCGASGRGPAQYGEDFDFAPKRRKKRSPLRLIAVLLVIALLVGGGIFAAPKLIDALRGDGSEDAEVANAGGGEVEAESQEAEAAVPSPTKVPEKKAASSKNSSMKTQEIAGGTNQNDAVALPMDTKLYGTATKQGLWYSFTTGTDTEASYQATLIHKSLEVGNYVSVFFYDETGEMLKKYQNGSSGIAGTANIGQLPPNTTYYLRVMATNSYYDAKDVSIDYTMIIWDQNNKPGGSSILRTDVKPGKEIQPGTNQDDAASIPLDERLSLTASDGIALWYAFTTGEDAAAYRITTVNETLDSYLLTVFIYDDAGNKIGQSSANNSGTAETVDLPIGDGKLQPNTTYYLRIAATNTYGDLKDGTIQYTLAINSQREG